MANYVSLEEAAKILGVSTDALVEMRSKGEIFGYRDGASWKFKQEEIERVLDELGDIGDGDDEISLGSDVSLGSDLRLAAEDAEPSDVALIPDPRSDSGVKLVNRSSADKGKSKSKDSESSDLKLEDDGSDLGLGSDLKLEEASGSNGSTSKGKSPGSNVLGSDLGAGLGSKASKGLGSDLELTGDDEDELVLGSDSAIGIGSESGINLMSPSDSGLSLEDEPLDLAGTGISGLDLGAELAAESASSSKLSSTSNPSGIGAGLVDQNEEFQLTPSSVEADDDSGSQVIELEDSESFGDGLGLPEGSGFDGAVQEAGAEGGFGAEELGAVAGAGAGAALAMRPTEVPYSGFWVGMLALVLVLMGLCGILTSDILRNLWAWDGQTDYSTGLTSMLVKALGGS
ncbi:MAG: helix-turn-helix domain-containing protein [Planctomycetota bacterium]|jgi:excisionase family DNA binding protein